MRKTLTILAILAMALMLFAGCAKKEAPSPEPAKAPEAVQPATPTPAETPVPAETPKPAETAPVVTSDELGVSDADLDLGDNPDAGLADELDVSLE